MELFGKVKKEIVIFLESLKKIIGDDSTIGNFLKSQKNRMGIGSPERNAADTYERGMEIVPACIKANENEIPIKQYNIAVLRNLLKFERAEGRMQVTNKRVIFRAAGRSVGGRTTLQHEFAIDEIARIEAVNNFKFSVLYLIFAVLILACASLILYQSPTNYRIAPPQISFTGVSSPPRIESNSAQANRNYKILNPKHIQKAYENERLAISRTRVAEESLLSAQADVQSAQEILTVRKEAEESAFGNVTRGIQKSRRVQTGTNWWGQAEFEYQSYRDTSSAGLLEAQAILDNAILERENAEAAEQSAIAEHQAALEELEAARENQMTMIQNREWSVNVWKILMTLFGLIVGIGALIPFFMLNKKFGIKLFILSFSAFGFALSLTASGVVIFSWLLTLANIITVVCVFLFCFRPNLIISIKNEEGLAAAVDIRRDTIFTRRKESGIGFGEIIPTDETESAIREIGAIITDIQKLGDIGIQKWIKGGN